MRGFKRAERLKGRKAEEAMSIEHRDRQEIDFH